MAPGGSRGPKNGHILPMMAIFAHRHLQRFQMGWTLVEQGWTLSNTSRVTCLGPQGPQKVTPGVPRDPKTAIFCPKCPFLAIGTSNSSKWVGHWLDKVGYYQTHPEGSIWTLKAPKKWHRRPQRRQKWPFLALLGPWCHFMGAQNFGPISIKIGQIVRITKKNDPEQVWAWFGSELRRNGRLSVGPRREQMAKTPFFAI